MATATLEIRALTAGAFRTPEKFTEFCLNDGKPLGGIVDGEQIAGSMNATVQTIDPGSQEVLATVCDMGEAEVARAVTAAQQAFDGDGKTGWGQLDVEERIKLVQRLVELCERDRDILLACEVRDGGKVSELAEGFPADPCLRPSTSSASPAGSLWETAPSMPVAEGVRGFTHREPWGVVAGIIPWNYPVVLTSWFMFPALLSGNAILIKPAEDTPLSAALRRQAGSGGRVPGGGDQRLARPRRDHRPGHRGKPGRAVHLIHGLARRQPGDPAGLRPPRHPNEAHEMGATAPRSYWPTPTPRSSPA